MEIINTKNGCDISVSLPTRFVEEAWDEISFDADGWLAKRGLLANEDKRRHLASIAALALFACRELAFATGVDASSHLALVSYGYWERESIPGVATHEVESALAVNAYWRTVQCTAAA